MVIFTNCKINIGLDIVRRREDGYHDIVTAMVPVPWHDVVEVVPAEETTLTVLGRKVDCNPADNLVMKAYEALYTLMGLPPVQIVLQKIVPDGAGLGGGSGDASATLLALNQLCNLGLDTEQLSAIAARLGADCPMFLHSRQMLATGTGTTLRPIDIDLGGYTLLIVKNDAYHISTKEAYRRVVPAEPATPLPELLLLPVDQWQGRVKNDFEPSVFAAIPQLRTLRDSLLEAGAVYASLTGSGSAVYGLFRSAEAATRAAQNYPGMHTFEHTY